MDSLPSPVLSVVLPCHNEQENLLPLIQAIRDSLGSLKMTFEIVVTDDASTDRSWEVLKQMAATNPGLRLQRFATNSGQSAALWAGIRAARGSIIATLDSDLQNDPRDLPLLIASLDKFDCVCGSRVAARGQGDNFMRIVSSRIANSVRNRLSGENISDAGCCFRVFKRECVANLKFFKGMHRFLPTLIKMEGYTVTEVPIRQNPRVAGASHYGVWNRLLGSFYDLLAVRWMKKRMSRFEISERVN